MNLYTFGHYGNHVAMDECGWGVGLMVLFWIALLIVGILLAMRLSKQDIDQRNDTRVNPIDIAKERYAKGDISKSEYEQIHKDLAKK